MKRSETAGEMSSVRRPEGGRRQRVGGESSVRRSEEAGGAVSRDPGVDVPTESRSRLTVKRPVHQSSGVYV